MAQNDISLMGAVYPDVPAVTLPLDGGGTATFTDVSDSTVTASDVLNSKYFYNSSGQKQQGTATGGGTGAISIVDTADAAGGTVRTITAVDISSDTVTAGSMLNGVTAHDASGAEITGNIASKSSSDLTASTLTVTAPAGYYAEAATKTLTDNNLSAGNIKKDVQIFGVTGSYEGGGGTTWDTQFDGTISVTNAESGYYYGTSSSWYVDILENSVWRVTWNGTPYECTATYTEQDFDNYAIGDPGIIGATPSGNNEPFLIARMWGSVLVAFSAQSGTYSVKLEKQVSGGSTLITKTITANGTYDAEDDDADGYSSVTVNVAGSISNTVTGTFNFDSTKKGTAQEITLNYSGAGYPIAVMIYPSEGAANASGTAYTRLQRNSQFIYMAIKSFQTGSDATPTYNGSGNNNLCSVVSRYKSSSSNASSLSANATSDYTYNNANASASYSSCVKFKSATKMSVFIANTSYGFLDSVDYRYVIQYSS